METKKIAIGGTITEATYCKKFDEKQPYYRVSVKITDETREKVADAVKPYFEGVAADRIPKWLKGESSYLNLKSKYPVKVLDKETKEEHVISANEDLAGSKGFVLVNVKEDGIFLAGLLIEERKHTSLSNFFEDKDSMLF